MRCWLAGWWVLTSADLGGVSWPEAFCPNLKASRPEAQEDLLFSFKVTGRFEGHEAGRILSYRLLRIALLRTWAHSWSVEPLFSVLLGVRPERGS